MEVIISGLNSYLGKRAMSHLNKEDFHVHGLVRDVELFRARTNEELTGSLNKVDLLRRGKEFDAFKLEKDADLAIYITHVPELGEMVNLNLEIITLNNFIELARRNNCSRIIYIARLMDKPFVSPIKAALEASGLTYTVILKNLAIGRGSVLDRYMRQVFRGKYLPYDSSIASVKFSPISALDLLRWIYNVDWKKNFLNETIEIGGPNTLTIQEMFRLYRKHLFPDSPVKSIRLPHAIMSIFYKKFYHINSEDLVEFNRLMKREYPIDNSNWKQIILFSFTPLDQIISGG
ncbi:hypothetical protein GQF61_00870 [Sphingobacterium sp. DK4209]|uniref:NAD(P)H-binding protein n=1 Tax=Sphingobacterium zhuxiongii TaxID=2662364 RepID=A0A5Q0Q6N4_9SPHI|nr:MULTISPECIES: hypothetical protein [unclassified Sphingobacterium]MVZ64390.1 hypothetical protein [Sphingobacterium sp. DK4209]QGA25735.1 hypothetical protein GFH32_05095 [Sphingobacterium sp. dk4302]